MNTKKYFVGSLITLDLSLPKIEKESIESLCNGDRHFEGYTDRKGNFSFEFGKQRNFSNDDVATSSIYSPALTTIRQPLETMGGMAVGIMLDGINAVLEKRETSALHRKVAPELVVRESTHPLL